MDVVDLIVFDPPSFPLVIVVCRWSLISLFDLSKRALGLLLCNPCFVILLSLFKSSQVVDRDVVSMSNYEQTLHWFKVRVEPHEFVEIFQAYAVPATMLKHCSILTRDSPPPLEHYPVSLDAFGPFFFTLQYVFALDLWGFTAEVKRLETRRIKNRLRA